MSLEAKRLQAHSDRSQESWGWPSSQPEWHRPTKSAQVNVLPFVSLPCSLLTASSHSKTLLTFKDFKDGTFETMWFFYLSSKLALDKTPFPTNLTLYICGTVSVVQWCSLPLLLAGLRILNKWFLFTNYLWIPFKIHYTFMPFPPNSLMLQKQCFC